MPTNLFGFSENPFVEGHDPRFLYPSRAHREAVARLRRGIESREPLALVTGLPGVGKTIAIQAALAEAGPYALVSIPASPSLTREQFREHALAGFAPDGSDPASPGRPADGIEARLRAVRAAGRMAFLVVEEAQDLSQPLLDDLRLYSNLEAGGQSLLQIILAGQPALEETLSRPACDALRQRIAVRCRLDPLSAEETEGYVRHRVAVAGGEGRSLFSVEACQTLHRLTHGIPREIDQLASEALILANTSGEDGIVAGHIACAAVLLGFRSAARDVPLPADATEPVAEAVVETPLCADAGPCPAEHAAPAAEPPVMRDVPVPESRTEPLVAHAEELPVAHAQEPPVAHVEESPIAHVEELPVAHAEPLVPLPPVEPVAAPVSEAVEPRRDFILEVQPAAPAPRHAGPRRRALPGRRFPRTGHQSRAAFWTTSALLFAVASGLVLGHSSRSLVRSRPPARLAVATSGGAAETGQPVATPVTRPSPVPAPSTAAPARPTAQPASAARPAPAETGRAPAESKRAYAVEVATFISESRAVAERDRVAAATSLPCRIVPSDEDGYAVVVGPVASSKEATRLSVDLSGRGLVGQARVVRWAASGGARP